MTLAVGGGAFGHWPSHSPAPILPGNRESDAPPPAPLRPTDDPVLAFFEAAEEVDEPASRFCPDVTPDADPEGPDFPDPRAIKSEKAGIPPPPPLPCLPVRPLPDMAATTTNWRIGLKLTRLKGKKISKERRFSRLSWRPFLFVPYRFSVFGLCFCFYLEQILKRVANILDVVECCFQINKYNYEKLYWEG